jgi:hypothetical protein
MSSRIKSAIESRTIWLNGITTAIAIATALGGQEWVAMYPRLAATIAGVIGGLNIALRFLTTQPIWGRMA